MSMEDERLEENRRPTAGIDWASADHAVAVVDAHGSNATGSSSRTPPQHCAARSIGYTAPGSAGWRSSGPTAQWSTRCWRPV
jgi:hypothetical protein